MLRYFAQVVAHELRQPLNAARLQVGLARLAVEVPEQDVDMSAVRDAITSVDGALRELQRMVDEHLDFATGQLTEAMLDEECDLEVELVRAVAELSDDIESSSARVRSDGLPTVRGSRSFLRHVITNIVGNALKYAGDRVPEVRLDAVDEGDVWRVRIADNGVGMTPEESAHAFELFKRSPRQTHVKGSGIGLALCRQIVRRHGGTIEVTSEPGRGSTFSFTLPKVRATTSSDDDAADASGVSQESASFVRAQPRSWQGASTQANSAIRRGDATPPGARTGRSE